MALLLVAVLHFLPDDADPHTIVSGLIRSLPPGSYLVASHGTADYSPPDVQAQLIEAMRHGAIHPRTRDEFGRFFEGMELVEPGVVSVADWRPEPGEHLSPALASAWGAVALRP